MQASVSGGVTFVLIAATDLVAQRGARFFPLSETSLEICGQLLNAQLVTGK